MKILAHLLLLLIGLLGGALIWYMTSPRTVSDMQSVAEHEFQDWMLETGSSDLVSHFTGPTVCVDSLSEGSRWLQFQWQYVLTWGDTVKISVGVSPVSSIRQLFFDDTCRFVRTTSNYAFAYLYSGHQSNLKELIPPSYTNEIDSLRPFSYPESALDGVSLLKPYSLLFYFLQEGYFRTLSKNERFAVVQFYDEIAIVPLSDRGDSTVRVRSAQIYVNQKGDVLIIPVTLPDAFHESDYVF